MLLFPACNGTDEKNDEALPQVPKGREVGDFWLERFEGYMTSEFREEYLATPPDERFGRFGEALLEYHRREALLLRSGLELDEADLLAYRRLPSIEASEEFLAARTEG